MAFWLEHSWQQDAATTIMAKLQDVAPRLRGKGNRESTRLVMTALSEVAPELCRRDNSQPRCSFGGGEATDHRKGWLYDFCCWLAENECSVGIPIVAESEWGKWSDVIDDFEKLVQARAGIRVMIFDRIVAPDGWRQALLENARRFEPHDPNDAWLFAAWRDGVFDYWSNRTNEG